MRTTIFFIILTILPLGAIAEDEALTKINFPKIRNVNLAKKKFGGKKIQILGWMVPVDAASDVKYFLLVSNSRYCVHVPPPPINQIVFVTAKDAASVIRDSPVIVRGDLEVAPLDHDIFGKTIYRLSADSVEKAY